MALLWGSETRAEVKGLLGDYCPVCREVTRFTVAEHRRNGRVFFVPGMDDVVARSRVCDRCGCRMAYRPEPSHQLAPESDAYAPISELVDSTNPSLREALVAEKEDGSGSGDPRLAEHLEKLAELGRTGAGLALLFRLDGWEELDEEERLALGAEVDALAAEAESEKQVLGFVERLSRAYPANAGCLPGLLAAVALLAGVVAVRLPVGPRIGVFMIALLVASWIYYWIASTVHKRWLESRLLPYQEQSGIDSHRLVQLLDRLVEDSDAPYKLRQFARTYGERLRALIRPES